MPTTSSCRFLRILAHVDGSRQAWVTERNTSRSVLRVGSKGPTDGLRDHQPPNKQPYWRGVGGRRYGTSEDIETLQGKNNPSTCRLRAVEECGSSLSRRSKFARIIRSRH